MTLLYESDLATVHFGDARDILPRLTTESFDLVVTDPPYGVEWQSGFRAEAFDQLLGDGGGERSDVAEVLRESVRLVGQKRHLYIFGPADVLEGLKVSAATPLIWDKGRPGMGDLASSWGPAHEDITFTVSLHRHAGQRGQEKLPNRIRKGSVLRFPPITGRKVRHPSEKPVDLLRELVESSSRQGELVLDPFAGVGSTGVAAILSGRRTFMVELKREYAEIAVDRIRRAEEIVKMAGAA
jgi:DNA modification methylase